VPAYQFTKAYNVCGPYQIYLYEIFEEDFWLLNASLFSPWLLILDAAV